MLTAQAAPGARVASGNRSAPEIRTEPDIQTGLGSRTEWDDQQAFRVLQRAIVRKMRSAALTDRHRQSAQLQSGSSVPAGVEPEASAAGSTGRERDNTAGETEWPATGRADTEPGGRGLQVRSAGSAGLMLILCWGPWPQPSTPFNDESLWVRYRVTQCRRLRRISEALGFPCALCDLSDARPGAWSSHCAIASGNARGTASTAQGLRPSALQRRGRLRAARWPG